MSTRADRLGLLWAVIFRAHRPGDFLEPGDLVNIGYRRVLSAARCYDPCKGPFALYASVTLKKTILVAKSRWRLSDELPVDEDGW